MIASLRYVLRNLHRQRTRTLMGALGIFLTLTLLTAIQIGLDSVSTSYTGLAALQAGKADVVIQATGGNWVRPVPFAPEEVEKKLAGNPHLRGVSPRWTGLVQIEREGQSLYAVLVGLDPDRERQLDISGLEPEPTLGKGIGALSQSLAKKLNASKGSTLTIRSPSDGFECVVRLETILERQLILPQEVRDYVAVDAQTARSILGNEPGVHSLAGALREPSAYYDARDLHQSVLRLKAAGDTMAASLGMNYEVRLPKAGAIAAFDRFSSPLQAIFGVFALLALSVTGLLIYSILSVAVEERIREYAILRTLGAHRRYLFGLVLAESAALCLLGVAPGVLAGVAVARVIVRLIELAMHAQAGAIAVAVSPATLWLTAGAGIAVSLGSALIPALRSMRRGIIDGLDPLRRGQIQPGRSRETDGKRPLFVSGAVLSVLSAVVFFILPSAFLSGNPSLIGTVVLCLLLVLLLGFTMLAVGAMPWSTRLAMAAIGWTLGPSAELATKNLARNRRRNNTTALMFILSVSMVIFIASLVVLFSHTAMTMVEQNIGADIRLQAGEPPADGLKSELAQIRGVQGVSEVRMLRSRTENGVANDILLSDLVGMKSLWVVPFGVDPQLTNALYATRIQYEEGGPAALQKLAASGLSQNDSPTNEYPIVLSLAAARYLDARAGDLVHLSFRLGSARADGRFRVAAVCGAIPGFENFRSRIANAVGSGVLIPLNVFNRLTASASPESLLARYFVRVDSQEETQKSVAGKIREDFDVRYRFGVKSTLEQKQQARILYWVTQVFFGLLLAVAVVISVFALIASMATAVIERRWEIGVLKALGLRRGGLFKMFLGEAVGLTLAAGGSGGVVGFAVAYMFALEASALMEIPMGFTLPYVTFLATFGICLLAGTAAAYYPTRHLLRKSAAEILRLSL